METRLTISNQVFDQHRFINTLDNQKEGKHSYFSSDFLEETFCNSKKKQPTVSFKLLHSLKDFNRDK